MLTCLLNEAICAPVSCNRVDYNLVELTFRRIVMSKKVAVIAVNPVNGYGLFHYLESFYENKIAYRVYAIDETVDIKTNSGIALKADDVIANLKGKSADYDALVFACGDAIPVFAQHAGETRYQDMFAVINEFAAAGKLLVGHCGGGLIFDIAGITSGRKIATHPYVQANVKNGIATGKTSEVDGNFYTAQDENNIGEIISALIEALK